MKGVILAGGRGTRLFPCTLVVNKHLLPIYDQPMIYYPIKTLVDAGCKQILIVTGGQNPGEFMRLLGDGSQFGLESIFYAYQSNPTGGIADALKLARSFVNGSKFCVVLGDNLIFDDLSPHVQSFEQEPRGTAKIFIKEIENPISFGVAELDHSKGKVTKITEKPKIPATNYAVIGVYMYDSAVFDIIDQQVPSARGEMEITDVNQAYIDSNNSDSELSLTYAILDSGSEWLDTGSFASLYRANSLLSAKAEKTESSL